MLRIHSGPFLVGPFPAGSFLGCLLLAGGVLASCSLRAVAQTVHPDTLSLPVLLDATTRHPAIRAKEAALEAARNRLAKNSSLPEPMLELGVQGVPTNSFRFDQDMMTGKSIGVSQHFPFPGKLAAERTIAGEDTVTRAWEVAEEKNLLERETRIAYFDIYHLQMSSAANNHHVRLLTELIQAAEQQLALGKSSEQDVLNLRIEQASRVNEVLQDQVQIAQRKALLTQLTAIEIPDTIYLPDPGLPELPYSLHALDSIALRDRPLLQRLRSEAVRSGFQADREALERYPDFSVSLMYLQRDALAANAPANPMNSPAAQQLGLRAEPMPLSDMLAATLSITLPTNSEQHAEAVAEARATQNEQQESLRAAELTIHGELEAELAALRALREQYTVLTKQILPLVQASESAANSALAYGKTDMETVLRNDINLLHQEHEEYRLKAEYNKAIAQIEYLVGRPLLTQ